MSRKITRKYYFSVEGETEEWYLEWLQKKINDCDAAKCNVFLSHKKQKDPLKRAKSLTNTGKVEIWHFSDYESDEEVHVRQFTKTMDRMKEVKELKKQITYKFGYSNLTFDLWIILHKEACSQSYAHRKNYITPINHAFGESFENMAEFKKEDNFKRCLKQLELQNVIDAIGRAKKIMETNQRNGYKLYQYKGYNYYKENPSLMVWQSVENILQDCGLL